MKTIVRKIVYATAAVALAFSLVNCGNGESRNGNSGVDAGMPASSWALDSSAAVDTTAAADVHIHTDANGTQAPLLAATRQSGPATIERPIKRRVRPGDRLQLHTEGLTLTAGGDAVKRGGEYSVTPLHAAEVPPMPEGMTNVTAILNSQFSIFNSPGGYRLLPSGEHFSPAAELRVAYDPALLPPGMTPDDIYTSYYDTEGKVWTRLERIAVDTAAREIVSLTTHFTDFVNEVLKLPEMPEASAFVPTAMTDLEAVNPLDGLPMIQPPTANNEGTANLTYPIWIPSGRHGMQPSLALTYNSGGGNGWLGVGWDISVPSITIDTRWGVPRYDATYETEIYTYNGEQLVRRNQSGEMLPLPHRTNSQQARLTGEVLYHARTGDAHDSIVRHGDSTHKYYWEVWDKSGTVHYFGHYPDAAVNVANSSTLVTDKGDIARWMLCESRDPYGNWVRYFYDVVTTSGTNSGRQIYLSKIEYTGNAASGGAYRVVFNRKARNSKDKPVSCNYGFKEETTEQLCNIAVMTADKAVTGYWFESECVYGSNFKTRLKSVIKIDSLQQRDDLTQTLLTKCSSGNINGYKGPMSKLEFSYNNAPTPESLFGPTVRCTSYDDHLGCFMLTPQCHIDSVIGATALGLSQTSGWNIGGSAAVGTGFAVCFTDLSIGGNYHRGNNASETLSTLVDLDGDGLPDKVFVRNGVMYWRKQIPVSGRDTVAFSPEGHMVNASHFLVESGTSNTFGVQASVAVASGSVSWTNSTSCTSVYFADVDGDGLVDIVDNGSVLFNRPGNNGPRFIRYADTPSRSGDGIPSGPQAAEINGCGGITFDGAVNDRVGCRIIWSTIGSVEYAIRDSALAHCHDFTPDSLAMSIAVPVGNIYRVYSFVGRMDCSQRNLSMDGVPKTEAVRVWVVPEDGTVKIASYVHLLLDDCEAHVQSHHADGVTYTIQHSHITGTDSDTLQCSSSYAIRSQRITTTGNYVFSGSNYDHTDSNIIVNRGDLLFFRLGSNDDMQFDDVEDHVKITFVNTNNDTTVYLSDSSFILTDERYFRAPEAGTCTVDWTYTNTSPGVFDADLAIGGHDDTQLGSSHHKSVTILKDSTVRIDIATSSSSVKWHRVKCRARICYKMNGRDDSVVVWTPGNMHVEHPSGSKWGDIVYRRLFGVLYNGWGQFTYRPKGGVSGPFIQPGSLKPTYASLAKTGDTAGLDRRLKKRIIFEDFNYASLESFTNQYGPQYNPLSDSSCWVDMEADAEHWRWKSYGAQNSIGCDTMSNSMQDFWYYSARDIVAGNNSSLPPQTVYDDAVPSVIINGTAVKSVRKVTRSSNCSYNVGVAIVNDSYSRGDSRIDMDYLDLNGDRYPDIVGTDQVQYRSQWGGLGEVHVLPPTVGGGPVTATQSTGAGFGASPVSHSRVISSSPSRAKFTLSGDGSLGGSISLGWDRSPGSWTDINGDGLPDYITDDSIVHLNTGYGFLMAENWHTGGLREGQSASASFNYGTSSSMQALTKYNVFQGSLQLGAGLSRSLNRTGRSLIDINGDGLPDMVWRDILDIDIDRWSDILSPLDSVHVKFNLGNGNWSGIYDLDFKNFNWSESYNESLDVGATVGFTVLGAVKITGGVSATPYSSGSSRDRMQLADINGDGLPDLVMSSNERDLTVRYNKSGMTNLLKSVENFTGSKIQLEYTLSDPSTEQPSRQWLMTKVTTRDPLRPYADSVTVTRMEYLNPQYDRYERSFYGYGKVVTRQINPSNNNTLRSVTREYHNGDILFKGKPKREYTTDVSGNKYIEKEYRYGYKSYVTNSNIDTCSGNAYSESDSIITRHFDNGATPSQTPKLTTLERYKYDQWHNVTYYYDEGDTAYSDDGLYISFTYRNNPGKNMTGLRSSYKVFYNSGGSGWMRRDTCIYDNVTGALKKRTLHNTSGTSVYDFWYDAYGNMDSIRMPANANGQRMYCKSFYDNTTHTYPTKIRNSYGDSVVTVYNLVYGKPLSVADPTGSVITYTYDPLGRLLTVKSPLNNSLEPSIRNFYFPPNHIAADPPMTRPYASTYHYGDNGALVTATAVITDGFGRVIQTKKGATVGNVPKWQVSGRAFTDALGRVVKQHEPTAVDTSSSPLGTFVSAYDNTVYTETTYDILDRELSIHQVAPSISYTTTKSYNVANDASNRRRFRTQVTDPNNHTTTVFSDYEGRQVQVTDALSGVTRSVYDALGQLTRVTDPEGFYTVYTYDKLGRMLSRVHPDAGTTTYTYDAAGNLTQETSPLGYINYTYSYNRLTQKQYSNLSGNNVTYTYGTTGTGRGRITGISDGTGTRALTYDALGNVILEDRLVAIPGVTNAYQFVTEYTYDSWGRMLTITYPDGEVVTYNYVFGGDLFSMEGQKGYDPYRYIDSTVYNAFGQKTRVWYGNNVRTTYEYDPLHRLVHLQSKTISGTLMQDIAYNIDGVGNISLVNNNAVAVPGTGIGGKYTNTYYYDGLNRLTTSQETHNSEYDLSMDISPSGRLAYRRLASSPTVPSCGEYVYGYCGEVRPHAPRRILETSGECMLDLLWDEAGNLGQINTVDKGDYSSSRFLFWTSDSRLHTAVDDIWHSYYAYDHAGERTLKLTGNNSVQDINGGTMTASSVLDNVTVYPSPYMVATNKGYTKHYYAGAERVCARIGGGGLYSAVQSQLLVTKANELFGSCMNSISGHHIENIDFNCIYGIENHDNGMMRTCIKDAPSNMQITSQFATSDFVGTMAYYYTHNDPETNAYYYHSDHLGSASWISGSNGQPVQHLRYLPYGEPFVNQRATGSTYNERYTFTGKERDAETGYSYFGSRYYDSGLPNIFLSVDPMSDKYPNISPYAYCAWNPVKLVDPDGREIWKPEILEDGTVNYVAEKGDNAITLQKQYGLSKEDANKLYSKISSDGKISGEDVSTSTSSHSEILKYNYNYRSGNKMRDIQRRVYHAGFACLYNKVKQQGRDFRLSEFFIGLGENYSGINSRDGFGNRPNNLSVPALGGGDIPIRDFSCQAGGNVLVHQDGSWKQTADLNAFRLLYNQSSRTNTKYEMHAFSFTFPNSAEEMVKKSYRQ